MSRRQASFRGSAAILADRRMSHPSLDGSAFRRDLARIVGRD
ncbi:hypothetical protein ACIBK9_34945 [Nonomuraea sp. NPDC050227]